ncbi:hypothetical protein GALMADRAFT_244709 [Galerina marginata CBS 339.88]|uniref:Uncharacterized protein n=1 Tax=Galerina marginata (strain CBS 339.88) TaxID=685588 RepID=A0A067T9I0_GALM3|nr:hypothetical protein GALMADRAFT_244709 [Galerina marginata CBS 339.88]
MLDVFVLALPIPVIGTVVRYRATYYPKSKHGQSSSNASIALLPATPLVMDIVPTAKTVKSLPDIEANVGVKVDIASTIVDREGNANAISEAPNFLGVFKKVWKSEGFEGLFKGIFPGLCFSLFFVRGYVSPAPITFLQSTYTILPLNLLYLIFMITTYRFITTPHKIRYSAPRETLRHIFSEYERQHPFWSLHYSGLLLPFVVLICLDFFLVQWLYSLIGNVGPLLNHFDGEEWWKVFNHPVWKEWAKVCAYWLIAIVSTIFLAPADVIITRLAIQPVHGNSEPTEERDVEKLLDAGVIVPTSYLHLTTEQKHYLSFLDCFYRIVEEEGWGVLYRVWFLTFLGCLVPYIR